MFPFAPSIVNESPEPVSNVKLVAAMANCAVLIVPASTSTAAAKEGLRMLVLRSP